jgi:hypothetical protein
MRVVAAVLVCLVASLSSGCALAERSVVGSGSPSVGTGHAAASCVGPYLDDQPPAGRYGVPPPTVAPGETLVVYGHWYTRTCNDTGHYRTPKPMPDVTLTVQFPDGRTTTLGPYPPHGRNMGFRATIRVPADMASGTVRLSDDQAYPFTYRFRVRR